MRKLFITFTIALLIIPTIAFAQGGPAKALLAALNAKFSPSIEAPQAKSAETQAVTAVTIDYQYSAIFPYQASNVEWWSGLVILNHLDPNDIMVGLSDSNGNIVGKGTFHLGAMSEQRVGLLKDMIGMGYVPEQGSVAVFGTKSFQTLMIVGNSGGGFGIIEKEVNIL